MNSDIKEVHSSIDNSFNSILNSLGIVFQSMKFNDDQIFEDTSDLEIKYNTENISQQLGNLLSIVAEMKVKLLKSEKRKTKDNKELTEKVNSKIKKYTEGISKLEETQKKLSYSIKEGKKNPYYRMSLEMMK